MRLCQDIDTTEQMQNMTNATHVTNNFMLASQNSKKLIFHMYQEPPFNYDAKHMNQRSC